MVNVADYERWKSARQKSSVGAAQVVMQGQTESPDQVAGDMNLAADFAKTTGNPQPPLQMVPENRSVFQGAIDRKRSETILSTSPRLTEWLRNPENAAVGRDDLDNLSWWERVSNSFKMGEATAITQGQEMGRDVAGVLERGFLGRDLDASREVIDENLLTNSEGKPNLMGRLVNWARARAEAQDGVPREMVGGEDVSVEERAQSIFDQPLGAMHEGAMAVLQEMEAQGFAPMTVDDVSGVGSALSFISENLAMSLPQMGAAMASGSFSPLVQIMMLGGEANAELSDKVPDLSPERRVAVSVGAGTVMTALETFGLGRVFGGLGVGQVAGEAIEGTLFERFVQAGMTQAASRVLVAAMAEGSTEALQESVVMGVVAMSGGEYEREEVIDRLKNSFFAGGAAGGGLRAGGEVSSGAVRGVERIVEGQRQARAAEARVTMFEELAGNAQSSKLRARLPDTFRKYVEAATANGPVENVFVPADQFSTYFQDQGLDPWALIDEMEGVTREDLDAAIATGGDLKIPTATYAASIAGSAHDAFLMDNMRFNPDEMTALEAREFNDSVQEVMQEAWDEAEAMRLEDEQYRQIEEQIFEEMVSRLRVAGRATDVARAEAMVYPAFYRVMAQRSGLTTEEFLERYPLPQVRGVIPQGIQTRDVDEMTRTLAAARNRGDRTTERPAGEALKARGGIDPDGPLATELKARGITPQTSPGLFKRGGLANADNIPLADVNFMAGRGVDDGNGYVSEQAWIDAIEAEARGEPWLPLNTLPDEQIDQIEEYLSSLGVSLDNTDEEIRAAIDGAAIEDARMYGQDSERRPRGRITLGGSGKAVIDLFERADLSTMLHESAHYFLTVMQDMAAKGEPAALTAYEAIKGWWRENAAAVARDGRTAVPETELTVDDVQRVIDAGTTGDLAKDAAVDVGMQEQWARGFEAYLMEGKAPNAELRGAFEKFRAWLVSIYRRLSGLNVPISDDIRAVFDRMLASDIEIENARADLSDTGPIFATAEQMGMTEEEYQAFIKVRSEAEDSAKARMLAEAMAPIKRERDKAYRAEKQAVREEVERNVNASPVYRAYEWMANNRWMGDNQPENLPRVKLSKQILVDRYGDGVLKTLTDGRRPVYAVEGGVDPDDVAGWFGFDSGDQMVKAIEQSQKRTDAIDAEVERVMFERHGDVLRDGRAEAEAMASVHNDKRGQWLARELKAVVEVADRGTGLTAQEARATARETMGRMKVRDAMNANRFLAAERKAGQEAARLGAMLAREGVWMSNARRRIATKARAATRGRGTADGVASQVDRANSSTQNYNETVDRLISAKRRQLLNHAMYLEARKVAEEVGKAERYVKRLNKASKREKIAGAGRRDNAQINYLSAIDEIMGRYDFRRMSGRAEEQRGALAAFIEAMEAAGRENELAIPASVMGDTARRPYKTLPVDELRGVIDSLKNLEHIALRWNDLIDAQNQRKLDEAVEEITTAFDENLPKRAPGRVATTGERLRNAGRQYLDLVLNASTILREIDGFEDMGAAYRNIKSPIDDAMNRLTLRKEQAATDLEALYGVYSAQERRRMAVREHVPELGYAMSKWEKIAVALNTGNEGNYQRLTDGKTRGALSEAQVQAVLSGLDERDAAFVQSVWDYVGSFRDDIAARERRVTGVTPEWVEASPVVIAGKQLRGGYYPLKYDPRLSSLARDDQANDVAKALQAGRFGKAQTKNGHLEARAQSSGRDIELDMSVLHRHINQVVYDLELSEAVANGWRVLQDGRVRQSFIDAGKSADFDALEVWLKDVAEGQINSGDFVGRTARAVKSNFTAAKLAFNLSTVAVQITGLSQTMVVVGKRDFARGVSTWAGRGGPFGVMGDEIAAKSPFMRERQSTFNKDIRDFYDDPKLGPTASRWGDLKRDVIGPMSFWLMTKVQWALVDVPTWQAGYEQGLRKFDGDEAKAVAHADQIVKRAQASGLFSDRSAVERGSLSSDKRQSDTIRLFTTLGSYMFAKFNVAYERTMQTRAEVAGGGVSAASMRAALSWALDMVFLFTLEAILFAAIKGRLPDDEEDEDDTWAAFLARETAFGVMGTLPFVRDVASTMGGFEGGGAYGAVTKEAGFAVMAVRDGFDAILLGGEDFNRTDVKAIINGTGLATGLPSTQANRAVDALMRQAEGEDVSPLEYLLGRMN